jgi:hypothetical protein
MRHVITQVSVNNRTPAFVGGHLFNYVRQQGMFDQRCASKIKGVGLENALFKRDFSTWNQGVLKNNCSFTGAFLAL